MRIRPTAALIVLALAACQTREPPVKSAARDIVLVTIDTWRADAAGFAGNTRVKTPFLDSIAARGIVFENAHAHNVVTLPSHANILTGLLPYQHGVRENAGFVLDGKHPTVATMLQKAGFATGAFVAAMPLDARYGLNRGFDVYDDNYGKGMASLDFRVEERPAAAVLKAATDWWRSAEGRKRFLWIHLYDPHAPYVPDYLGEVANVDAALAASLAPLLTPETIVVVTGDHGEALGDHGELTHGLFAYESTLCVPLLIAGSGVPHKREAAFVRHIDIVPTLLELAGVAVPPELPGASLLRDTGARDSYFEALSANLNRGWAPLTGIIHGGKKYISLPMAELYALPDEARNVANDDRRSVSAARALLKSAGDVRPVRNATIGGEEAARLRSLGYMTGTSSKTQFTAGDDPKNLVALDRKMHDTVTTYERGDNAGALGLAREVVAARPDMSAGRELLAFALQQNERIDEAIVELRAAIATGATADVTVRLALLMTESGRAAEAVRLLEPLSSRSDADVLNALGIALADEGRAVDALRQFERVLTFDPNNAPALQNIGIVALRAGDLDAARHSLDRALALNPRLPLALNALGVVRARSGDPDGAVEMWRRAVAVDARQYDALFNIARVSGDRDALTQFVRTAPQSRYSAEIAAAKRALAARR